MRSVLVSLVGAAVLLVAPSTASAQEAIVSQVVGDNAFDATALAAYEGRGYELSQGLMMHGAIGLEGGALSNVFNQASSENPVASGLLRLGGTLHFATDQVRPEDVTATDDAPGVTPRMYEFRGGLRAAYEEYLTGNDLVRSQRNLNLNALGDLTVNPAGSVAFVVHELYTRDVQAPNLVDTSVLARDDNRLSLGLRIQPVGHTVAVTVHYDNWVEVFEDAPINGFANRMNHTVGALGEWQILPVTKLLAQFDYGFFAPLGNSSLNGMPFKSASQPLRATVGIATLLSSLITFKAHAGYARASYDVGEGYSAPVGGAELGYRWSPTGRIAAVYDYDHFDSFNANFYADHLFGLKAIQQLGALVLDASPELRLRHFGGIPMQIGPPDRDDVVLDIRANAQILFAERYAAYASYQFATVQTNYRATGPVGGRDDPSFARHEIVAGIRAGF